MKGENKMKKFKLKVGIDVDDVLFQCDSYAVELANRDYGFKPPLHINELESWGISGKRTDVIFQYFNQKEFFISQPLVPGAAEFVKELSLRAEIFFITAVAPEFMSIRAERLVREFPEVPKENIIMGYRKDMINVDVLLDDGAHNVIMSKSTYPVLMRKPWNRHMTGCLAVNSYEEFLSLIELILSPTSKCDNGPGKKVIALVGPSASGKTAIMKKAIENKFAIKVKSYTTRKRRPDESDDYYFVSRSEFENMKDEFFETTCYAGEYYGSKHSHISKSLEQGNHVIMALDICGAIALQKAFPNNTVLVFVKRPKKDVIRAILERDISNDDKTNRIISLSDEYKNEKLCDSVIYNNTSLDEVLKQLITIIND